MKKEEDKLNKGEEKNDPKKKKGHGALYAASLGRPATKQVDPHSNSGLANTGTNISYEGPTAPGSGGSAGTGYTSGQAGTGAKINTDSDYDQAEISKPNKDEDLDRNEEK